jgi:hypothetical protein
MNTRNENETERNVRGIRDETGEFRRKVRRVLKPKRK